MLTFLVLESGDHKQTMTGDSRAGGCQWRSRCWY